MLSTLGFELPIAGETIIGEVLYHETSLSEIPKTFFIHGAGTSHRKKMDYLREAIAHAGHPNVAFDHSGHGESSGELLGNSLQKRVEEALTLIEQLGIQGPLTLIGSSMGGHICGELLQHVEVENLILFCPGIYGKGAYELPFGEEFSAYLRQPGSWQDSHVRENLADFTGHLRVFIGEDDEVIPSEILEYIDRSATQTTSKKITIFSGVDHQIHYTVSDEQRKEIVDEVMSLF